MVAVARTWASGLILALDMGLIILTTVTPMAIRTILTILTRQFHNHHRYILNKAAKSKRLSYLRLNRIITGTTATNLKVITLTSKSARKVGKRYRRSLQNNSKEH